MVFLSGLLEAITLSIKALFMKYLLLSSRKGKNHLFSLKLTSIRSLENLFTLRIVKNILSWLLLETWNVPIGNVKPLAGNKPSKYSFSFVLQFSK